MVGGQCERKSLQICKRRLSMSCTLERHPHDALPHFMMAKRDKLESGAALPEGCAVGVSLHRVCQLCVSEGVLCCVGISFCFWVYR